MLQERPVSFKGLRYEPVVRPSSYHLRLYDIEFAGDWQYGGTVEIEGEVLKQSNEILVHASSLKVLRAEVVLQDSACAKSLVTSEIYLNQLDQTARLMFHESIPKGSVTVRIDFSGIIDHSMTGFFRARYEPASPDHADTPEQAKKQYMLATQFEPCDARKAFPCFDLPHLKATFELEVEVPAELTVLSNMPEMPACDLRADDRGLKVIRLQRTPLMSTYLLAWAIGDFEYVEAHTDREYAGKKLPVRVYAPRGLSQYGLFGVNEARRIIDFFSESFAVDYPLPKSDHIVVPEFISGAMENWGLITYKPTKILFDTETADNRLLSKASYIIAHELAHQWFGNLVSPRHWGELWLNEGFATWAGHRAVNYLHPEWCIWSQFVGECMEEAFATDSLNASHPVVEEVDCDCNAWKMFDTISYMKGCSLVRMLANYLGEEVFLRGLQNYLKELAYDVAVSADLWRHLSKTAGLDVAALMEQWIERPGYPIVCVQDISHGVEAKQKLLKSTTDDESQYWQIPLRSCNNTVILRSQKATIASITSSLEFNRDHTGFYRTQYLFNHLPSATSSLKTLSSQERVGIIADTTALVVQSSTSCQDLLNLLPLFKDDEDGFVWAQIQKAVSTLRSAISTEHPTSEAFTSYVQDLTQPARSKITWTGHPDDYVKGEFEKIIIFMSAAQADANILSEVQSRFKAWKSGNRDAIPRNLQNPIFGLAVLYGGEDEYNAMKAEYLSNCTIDGKEICIAALGRTKLPNLARDLLDFAFREHRVPLQNLHFVGMAVSNGLCAPELWSYVKQNWDLVWQTLKVNNYALSWFLENSLCGSDDLSIERDIAAFFSDKDVPQIEEVLEIVKGSIRRNAAFKTRARSEIIDYFE
ncbi:hypothetical protein QM012_007489 [Aureobasidium pullulans]|uniref:Aminopeptidase n=1 Tax=Aureobasidium pullulans TaxID=5580 RepID=A0ABR0TND4_AURPU